MIPLLVALILAALAYAAWLGWRSSLNPVSLILLAWSPALIFSAMPITFITPLYAVLNRGISGLAYAEFALALLMFAIGAFGARAFLPAVAKLGYPWNAGDQQRGVVPLLICFGFGLAVFLYAFSQSGLAGAIAAASEQETGSGAEVGSGRLAFHIGFMSHFVLFLDVASVALFAKSLMLRRLSLALPAMITLGCYLVTLQKSRVLFVVFSCIFLLLLYPDGARRLFFRSFFRTAAIASAGLLVAAGLIISNMLRGIGLVRFTDLQSPIVEQLFVYSGAPALRNFSATLEGSLPSDPPTLGLIFIRGILWPFADRDVLAPTRYLEGINNGTAVMFYWWDFRAAGVAFGGLLLGVLVTLAFRAAQRGTVRGHVAGAIAFYAVVMSIYTEVMFEATTIVMLTLAIIADRVSWLDRAAPRVHVRHVPT